MNTALKRNPWSRIRFALISLMLIVIYVWAFNGIKFEGFQAMAGTVTRAILSGFAHPDWGFVYLPDGEDLLRGLLDTLSISILGTVISAVLCVPFAFWAAANMSRTRWISVPGKVTLSFIRVFPEIIVAILFIKAVGPGAFAGVLALGIHSIGMLAKLFSETVEEIDRGPEEAMIACGANRLQILRYAVIPQIVPAFLSYSLYRFEINIRSAATLGLVGAGGIGTPLIFALDSRNWGRVAIILYGIIILVTVTDLISGWLRKRII